MLLIKNKSSLFEKIDFGLLAEMYELLKNFKTGFDYLENDSLLLRRTLYTESGTWTENGSHVRNTLMVFSKTK